jgi:hypothetical protein
LRSILRFALLLGIVCAQASAQANFSAEIKNNLTDSNFHTKIFSTTGKLRFEGADRNGRPNSIMLVNLMNRTSIVLMPQQHQYVENKVPQIPGQGVTFFQAKDADDACGDYQRIAETKDTKCRRVGHDTVNGRDVVKYELSGENANTGFLWVDAKILFPVKWANGVGKGELQNIHEGPQPPELFEIPAGFSKRHYASPATQNPAKP